MNPPHTHTQVIHTQAHVCITFRWNAWLLPVRFVVLLRFGLRARRVNTIIICICVLICDHYHNELLRIHLSKIENGAEKIVGCKGKSVHLNEMPILRWVEGRKRPITATSEESEAEQTPNRPICNEKSTLFGCIHTQQH